jgi:hypothetical protein
MPMEKVLDTVLGVQLPVPLNMFVQVLVAGL